LKWRFSKAEHSGHEATVQICARITSNLFDARCICDLLLVSCPAWDFMAPLNPLLEAVFIAMFPARLAD
jgi:hypothetical protein